MAALAKSFQKLVTYNITFKEIAPNQELTYLRFYYWKAFLYSSDTYKCMLSPLKHQGISDSH